MKSMSIVVAALGALCALYGVAAQAQTATAAEVTVATPAGAMFSDCPECPAMVIVPAGRFLMGSPPDEAGREDCEGPQHEVTLARPFAMGHSVVTHEQWRVCVRQGGCRDLDADPELGRPVRLAPGHEAVTGIRQSEAVAYARWLSDLTGQDYRLPSEAEWEYVARTARHSASGLGVRALHGRVWQWTQDCLHDSYLDAPVDGSAWVEQCAMHGQWIARGGSERSTPAELRPAHRAWARDGGEDIGFRVVRSLSD
jgi:formylglycine-generating enzyme required for sulfatase activity